MKVVERKIPLKFQPRYKYFVQKNVKRKMIVSFKNGKNISLDLNKIPDGDDYRKFVPLNEMENVSAIRLMVGRDIITISRKIPDTDGEYYDGFFYYGNADTTMMAGGYKSMIEYEILGFCYNAKGDSVEFQFSYMDIIKQLYRRSQEIEEVNKMSQKAEDKGDIDTMVRLDEEAQTLADTPLAFNIQRTQPPKSNVLFVGHAVHMYYELKEDEMDEFVDRPLTKEETEEYLKQNNITDPKEIERLGEMTHLSDYHKYRIYVIQREQYHKAAKEEPYRVTQGKLKEPRKVESPFIPRLPFEGIAPEVKFRTRETGNL